MKGLDLAEQYFFEHGLPMLENQFGDMSQQVAAGLVGPGSECYRFDDDFSRDHDWGPGFCLWINAEGFTQIGEQLQSAYQSLPERFRGYGPRLCSPGEEQRVGVTEIAHFYKTYTSLDHPPTNIQEWLGIPEEALSISTNGKVFWDPSGQFSSWRMELEQYYPEDVRIFKIANLCVRIAQSGQYNFTRSFKRGEVFAQRFAEMQFCDEVLSLTFLLNKQYSPFYKWRHHSVRNLPILGHFIYKSISELLETDDGDRIVKQIDRICSELVHELQAQDLTDQNSEFLLDHVGSRNRFAIEPT